MNKNEEKFQSKKRIVHFLSMQFNKNAFQKFTTFPFIQLLKFDSCQTLYVTQASKLSAIYLHNKRQRDCFTLRKKTAKRNYRSFPTDCDAFKAHFHSNGSGKHLIHLKFSEFSWCVLAKCRSAHTITLYS